MKKSELKLFIKENIIDILSEATEEEVENQKELNKELEKTAQLQKQLGEDEDIDDKDAIKAAKAAKGKNKRYALALQQLKKVEKNMASLGKDYSKASGVEKENILKQLKNLTNQKNELKSLVDKYADDLV